MNIRSLNRIMAAADAAEALAHRAVAAVTVVVDMAAEGTAAEDTVVDQAVVAGDVEAIDQQIDGA